MPITISSPDLEARLRSQAEASDLSVEAFLDRVLQAREANKLDTTLHNAPPDDEPLSPHELAALKQADLRRERGEPTIPHEEILREFGVK